MEFKYRAVDKVKPTATLHSPSAVTYLPHPSLQMQGGFSGFRPALTGEEALWRELEKEVIRREILRRMELEEEVRRELAMERELGISTQRPRNIHGLVSEWSNSTGHIGASQPQLILPPTETNPSSEISNNDKVIVLDKPDPKLFYAKRKAATLTVSETEPSALNFKKKLKEEWSCALCKIKATSKSGLNAHLNGKKHKIKEARQNKKISQSNITSEKIVNLKATETSVIGTKLEVDVEKGQHEQHNDAKSTNEKELAEVMVYNDEIEPQNEKSESSSTCSVSTKAPKPIRDA